MPGRGGDATGFASRAIELVDWNGDQKLDLIALGEGPRQVRTNDGKTEGLPRSTSYGLVVFLNEGAKGWRALVARSRPAATFGDSIAIGDWNADQRPDVVTVSYTWGNRDLLYLNTDDDKSGIRRRRDPVAARRGLGVRSRRRRLRRRPARRSGDQLRDPRGRHAAAGSRAVAGGCRGGLADRADRRLRGQGQHVVARLGRPRRGRQPRPGRHVRAGERPGPTWATARAASPVEESPELDPPDLCRGYGLELVDLDGDGRDEIVAGFAGETEAMLEFLGQTKCESGGALRVWRASPRSNS